MTPTLAHGLPLSRRPGPRRLLVVVALVVLLIAAAVPAVSATEIINESLIDFEDTSKVGTIPSGSVDSPGSLTGFYAIDVAQFDDISYFTLEVAGTQGYWPSGELIPEGRHVTSYTYNGETKPAVIYVSRNKNSDGSIISTKYTFFPQNWDRQNLVGGQSINTPLNLVNARGSSYSDRYIARTSIYTPETNLLLCNENGDGRGLQPLSGGFTVSISHATVIKWENNLRVTTDDEFNGYIVELIRTINGLVGSSTIEIYKNDSKVYTDNTVENLMLWYPQNDINKINISNPIRTHSFDLNLEIPVDPDDPATFPVTVYVKNSQTGALLANAQININEYGTGTWYNTTAEWGWTTVELPAGNYEFYAEYDGFTQVAPGRLTVNEAAENIVILLQPDSPPAPTGNITLQIWANYGESGDGRRYGVPGAEITVTGLAGEGMSFSSGNLTANNDGFVTVTAPGNSTYSVYASRVGYLSGESRVTVSTASPVKVSVGLTPGTLPTSPPLTPTIHPTTPKPTQTTPPGSFIDTSAGGLANLFGTTLETGKTLLGFLVALAVGMGTAKQLRGGAPEFVVGFLGASFLGLVAGLIPVGFFVLIALLCGVYLGKTYIGGGDNGR